MSLVELGPIDSAYLGSLRRWRNDESIYRWCRQAEPVSEYHHERYWQMAQASDSIKMYGLFSEPGIVGVAGFTSMDLVNRRAEFSLYVAPEYQRRGYGEAGLRALVECGFDRWNLHSIWGESYAGNPAVEVFKRVGFRHEGTRRDHYYRRGEYINADLWSLLKHEYDRT